MFNRRRDDALADIYEAGGSEIPFSSTSMNVERKLPSSMHEIIQYMFRLVFSLKNMAKKEIPRAFPHSEPILRYDHRYRHSSAEMLNAVPVTRLQDANLAIETCIKLKNLLTNARSILDDFYPVQLDHPTFKTELGNKFAYNINVIDGFIKGIEKIHNQILIAKGQGLSPTVNREELEKLKNHIIKIGFDKKTSNKELIEKYPSVFTFKDVSNATDDLPIRREGVGNSRGLLIDSFSDRFVKRNEMRWK